MRLVSSLLAFAAGRNGNLSRDTSSLHSSTLFDTESVVRSAASVDAEGTCIVGGGLSGLATAAALRNIACLESVHILERAAMEDFQNDLAGAAVQLGPNGLVALEAIAGEAFVDEICRRGTCLRGNAMIIKADENGKENAFKMEDTTKQETGRPQVLIRWGLLRSMLIELLPSDIINANIGKEITGYSIQKKGGASFVLAIGKDGKPVALAPGNKQKHNEQPPLLIAADGIHSTFQSLIQGGTMILPSGQENEARRANIKDGGRINIKAVAPRDLGDEFQEGYTYSFFSEKGAVACFAGPAGAGYTYWAISVADVANDTGNVTRFLSNINQADGRAVRKELISKLKNLNVPECQFALDLIKETDPSVIFVARSEERESVGPSLVSKDGHVVLVGDAAHAMSPAYGQAANFAFEDAATLASCIRNGSNLAESLQQYSEDRVERCIEMQRRSAERTAKATRGEPVEDISKWIFQWKL